MGGKAYRTVHDSFGELRIPAHALWGAQTQRAIDNFPSSGRFMPREMIAALSIVKAAAAEANGALGQLPTWMVKAIVQAALAVAKGHYDDHFLVDIYQTGSGTSSNMNANEVIATLACRQTNKLIHPNDHVNYGQSSNDVIPTAIRIAAVVTCQRQLLPALAQLQRQIARRARQLTTVIKTGRTHLMDAMPISMAQELGAWAAQCQSAQTRIADCLRRVARLPLGGTAVGTGVNTHRQFAALALRRIATITKQRFVLAKNRFEAMAAQDDLVELSGQLNCVAITLIKIANDLRWMNSGPQAGLGEIVLPALQPGSSIMPGKVNPVIAEAVIMACYQVSGYHSAITLAGQSGQFQLNVALPLIAANLIDGLRLLTTGSRLLAEKAIARFQVNTDHLAATLARNPVLVTALNPIIGYENAAQIAKQALQENRSITAVAQERTTLSPQQLRRLLDPKRLVRGGLATGRSSKQTTSSATGKRVSGQLRPRR